MSALFNLLDQIGIRHLSVTCKTHRIKTRQGELAPNQSAVRWLKPQTQETLFCAAWRAHFAPPSLCEQGLRLNCLAPPARSFAQRQVALMEAINAP